MTKQPIDVIRKLTTDAEGNLIRGSLTRIAEHLGVRGGTVRRWREGIWTPGEAITPKIIAMDKHPPKIEDHTGRCK